MNHEYIIDVCLSNKVATILAWEAFQAGYQEAAPAPTIAEPGQALDLRKTKGSFA